MPIQIAPGVIIGKPTITGFSPATVQYKRLGPVALTGGGTTQGAPLPQQFGGPAFQGGGANTPGTEVTLTGTNLQAICAVIVTGTTNNGNVALFDYADIPRDAFLNPNTGSLYHAGVITFRSATQLRFTYPPPAPQRGLASVVQGQIQVVGPNGYSNPVPGPVVN